MPRGWPLDDGRGIGARRIVERAAGRRIDHQIRPIASIFIQVR